VTVAAGSGLGEGDGLVCTGVAIGLALGLGLLATGEGDRAKREPLDAPMPQALTHTSKAARAASFPILKG
jgi:hypothetical protein